MLTNWNGMEYKGLQLSTKVAVEAISNIRTVAGLNLEQTFHDRYVGSLMERHAAVKRKAFYRGIIIGFASCAPMLASALVMYYGGWLVVHDGVDFRTIFKVSEALSTGTITVGQAVAYMPDYSKAKLAAGR